MMYLIVQESGEYSDYQWQALFYMQDKEEAEAWVEWYSDLCGRLCAEFEKFTGGWSGMERWEKMRSLDKVQIPGPNTLGEILRQGGSDVTYSAFEIDPIKDSEIMQTFNVNTVNWNPEEGS